MQNKVLIANRGEIALRVIRACKELGIPHVAIYSKADADSLHVKLADEAVCIGEAASSESYLNMTNIISAAIATGATAIHPGYGFLAENKKFVEMVEDCKIKFIGPSAKVIEMMGNKINAKRIVKSLGVPVIEGSDGVVSGLLEAKKIAEEVTYPILLKATNGGGGKGIRLVRSESELERVFELTSSEAYNNFGDGSLYIEKFIESPHHIEVQILADNFGNIIHLGERDCSIQRKNQKVIEESPSPFIDEKLREELGVSAIKIAREIGYVNAGTIEFIVDKDRKYYFIEMNTRVQVEHPVTEMLTNVDIVKEQIRIAYNQKLSVSQEEVSFTGHVIECRINAEDPYHNFRPSPGVIKNLLTPGGPGVRLDTHIYNKYAVPPYYDSMLAKLIVRGQTRIEAIRKMRVALEQFIIDGVSTNIEILYLIFHNTHFVRGVYDTNYLVEFLESIKDQYNE